MEIKLTNKKREEFSFSDIQRIIIDDIYRVTAVGGLQISKKSSKSKYDKPINITVINDFIVLK